MLQTRAGLLAEQRGRGFPTEKQKNNQILLVLQCGLNDIATVKELTVDGERNALRSRAILVQHIHY